MTIDLPHLPCHQGHRSQALRSTRGGVEASTEIPRYNLETPQTKFYITFFWNGEAPTSALIDAYDYYLILFNKYPSRAYITTHEATTQHLVTRQRVKKMLSVPDACKMHTWSLHFTIWYSTLFASHIGYIHAFWWLLAIIHMFPNFIGITWESHKTSFSMFLTFRDPNGVQIT
jgi:hypothetical protein